MKNDSVDSKLQACLKEFSDDISFPADDSNPLDNHYGTWIKEAFKNILYIEGNGLGQ